jgi:hypothetical protein
VEGGQGHCFATVAVNICFSEGIVIVMNIFLFLLLILDGMNLFHCYQILRTLILPFLAKGTSSGTPFHLGGIVNMIMEPGMNAATVPK